MTSLIPIACLLLGAAPADADASGLRPELAKRLTDRWGANIVTVEVWLQRSEGEEPSARTLSISEEYEEKRPVEIDGLAVDPRTVWMPELDLERRFIARMAVRTGAQGSPVAAVLLGSFLRTPVWAVRTEAPLAGVETISFVPYDGPPGSLFTLGGAIAHGGRVLSVSSAGRGFWRLGDSLWTQTSPGVLLVDDGLRPIGYSPGGTLGLEKAPDLWRGGEVAAGPVLEFAALERMREEIAAVCSSWILTVRGTFRHEEEEEGGRRFRRYRYRMNYGEGELKNEFLAGGFAVGPRRVLVNYALEMESAIRLEKIAVSSGGQDVPARFIGAYRDYRAFLVEVEKDLPTPLDLSSDAPFKISQPVVMATADFRFGRRRDLVDLNRISDFGKAYRAVLEPGLRRFPKLSTLLLDPEDRRLLGAVIEVSRESEDEDSRFRSRGGIDLRVIRPAELAGIAGKADGFDGRLVPRPAEREKDMVWLGVDFQPITRELARSNGVEIPTRGGEVGLLVLKVHPTSPAAKGGLVPGDLLLSVRPDDETEPSELRTRGGDYGHEDMFSDANFGDDMPDEVPAEYLASAGAPWPSPRNSLNEKMARYGAGRKVEVAYLREGKPMRTTVTLDIAPPDFETARKYKAEDIGLTVKDVTFEVRAFYRLKDDAPGVVISKVERGGKAAISKVLPFEILVSINGKTVRNVDEFRAALEEVRAAAGEKVIELKLERMGKSRLARIR